MFFFFFLKCWVSPNLWACEVVVKQGKERQGFYLHEVELTKKLTDVFKTTNGSTSMSSKLIIAHKIAEFNPNVKEHEESIKSDENLGKALYTINKEAKKLRDIRENI